MNAGRAIVIGNSDGIGLATTRALLSSGWQVFGISRSDSPIKQQAYQHVIHDICSSDYRSILEAILHDAEPLTHCIYCAGIGEKLDPNNMDGDVSVLEVNLLGLVKTTASVIPLMVKNGSGHFIGISSVADELLSPDAPSYHASKAGFSNYLEGLALALKPHGVVVTNIRFGFVDTKMAKGDVKPFMMSVEASVKHIMRCIQKKPRRYTAPKIVIPLAKFRDSMLRLAG